MTEHRNNRPPHLAGTDFDPAVHAAGVERRAVETPEYQQYLSTDPQLTESEILSIFGVRFFFRVNLRTCNFRYLAAMIDNGIIAKRSELLLLRGMLGKMKQNSCLDMQGERSRAEIDELEGRIMTLLDTE